jgi:hypothetical protein
MTLMSLTIMDTIPVMGWFVLHGVLDGVVEDKEYLFFRIK